MAYLVVGGRGKAGQSAIEAIRIYQQESGEKRAIYATTSGQHSVPGADKTITQINIHEIRAEDLAQRLQVAVEHGLSHDLSTEKGMLSAPKLPQKGARKSTIKALFYTPAFGPIGMPVSAVSQEDADAALSLSTEPIKKLADLLQPQLSIGYSAFYWLPHTTKTYGAMAYAKIGLERLALAAPRRYKAIRAGTFPSDASRGAALLIQRNLRKNEQSELQPLSREAGSSSAKKFYQFFLEHAFTTEKQYFQNRFLEPYCPTQPQNLSKAALRVLKGEEAPIINVIGDWIWPESDLPDLPADFKLIARN